MKARRLRRAPNGSVAVEQGRLNGWWMSWNPDDNRFYVCVEDDGVASATFARWTNATYWAKTHTR